MLRPMALLAAALALATIPHATSFAPPAIPAPAAAAHLLSPRHPRSHCSSLRKPRMEPRMAAASAGEARAAFLSLAEAGPKNGVGATEEQAKEIHAAIEELVGLSSLTEPAYDLMKPPYTYFDGTFELVYTNTKGGSSGKIGPFVGRVTQTFEGIRDLDGMGFSRRGIFLNAVELGPLTASLRARCESRSETSLAITFEEMTLSLFGVQVMKKPFELNSKGSKGMWDIKYMDPDTRILKTNANNWICMKRVEPAGGESWMQGQTRIGSQSA